MKPKTIALSIDNQRAGIPKSGVRTPANEATIKSIQEEMRAVRKKVKMQSRLMNEAKKREMKRDMRGVVAAPNACQR